MRQVESVLIFNSFSRRVFCGEQQAKNLGDMPVAVPYIFVVRKMDIRPFIIQHMEKQW